MAEKKYCTSCTLYLCQQKNREIQRECFIEIIHSSRPVYCDTCIISKNKEPMKKFEEGIQFFQRTQGNAPCFKLKSTCFYLLSSHYRLPREVNGLFLVQDFPFEPEFIRMSNLEFVLVLANDENFISTGEILKRAKEMRIVYGERAARYVLEYQQEIPEGWRDGYFHFLFPGTIRKSKEGKIFVPCISQHHDQLFLGFAGTDGHSDIGRSTVFVRQRS